MTTTPAIKFFPGVVDTGQPKSLKFTSVNCTAGKDSAANISLPTPDNEK
jgi:hypothetical protein